jgi:hypothetical protein
VASIAKGAEQNFVGPENLGPDFLAELSKRAEKGDELFGSLVLH